MDPALMRNPFVSMSASLLVLLLTPFGSAQDRTTGNNPITSTASVYDVADLTGHDRAALRTGPTPTDRRRTPMQTGWIDKPAPAKADVAAQQLVEFIETWISPPLGGPDRGQIVDWTTGGHLMVIGSPAHHEWVSSFLAVQRQQPEPIELRARLLSVSRDQLLAAGLAAADGARVMATTEARRLVAGLLAGGAQEVAAPRLTTFPRQRATVSILREQSFVVGWNLKEVMPGPTLLADPVVTVIAEGSVLQVNAAPLPDETYGIDVDLSVSHVEQPVRSAEIELHPTLPAVTFSLLSVEKAEAWTRAALVPEASMVFAAEEPDGDAVVVVIEFDVVDSDAQMR